MLSKLTRLSAATLMLVLCGGMAQANDAAAPTTPAASAEAHASAGPDDHAKAAAPAGKPETAAQGDLAAKPAKPRHPDTAGWRRIMAGSGRT